MAGSFIVNFEKINNSLHLTLFNRLTKEKVSTSLGFVCLFCLIPVLLIFFGSVTAKAEKPAPIEMSMVSVNSFSNQKLSIDSEELVLDPFSWMIKLYKNFLTGINSSKCPMYPSCSSFAAQALREHGEKGLFMTFDRLLRCGRDLEDYTLIFKKGRVLRYDPVIQRFEYNTDESPK